MNNQPNYVVKNFTASNDIIRHFIFSQAGTIDKAIAELVMNEVDAKATRIDIVVSSENKLTVSGNGVGFQSEAEVDELFSMFGFDHSTEKEVQRGRDFGKFGLGRAQIFAFGSCLWLSNQCEMVVDFKDGIKGQELPFLFKWHDVVQHAGCKVVVDLYKPLISHEYISMERTLRTMLKFVSTEIYFNGNLINTPYQKMEWKSKSEHLAFQPSSSDSASLNVYNKGVFVRSYGYSQFGIGGTVCSVSKTFELNVARNDIMVASCQLYEEMKDLLRPFSDKQRKKIKLSQNEQQAMIAQYLQGEVTHEDFMKAKLFPAAKGSDRSFSAILSEFKGQICLVQNNYLLTSADRELLQVEGGVMLLQTSSLAAFNLRCPTTQLLLAESYEKTPYSDKDLAALTEQLYQVLAASARESILQDPSPWRRGQTYVEYAQNEFRPLTFVDPHALLVKVKKIARLSTRDPSKYTPTQKVQVKVLQSLQDKISRACAWYYRRSGQCDLAGNVMRKVRFGDSDAACAWTDSSTFIAYDNKYVSNCMDGGVDGMLRLSLTIVHELMHSNPLESDPDEQAHSFEFYRNYEEALDKVFESGLYTWINVAIRQYWRAREKAGLSNLKLAKKVDSIPTDADDCEDESALNAA